MVFINIFLTLIPFLQQTIDAIGVAAGNAIQKPVQAAYRETFQNIVIPSFERATQNMCQQVGDVFQRGTKECEYLSSGFKNA